MREMENTESRDCINTWKCTGAWFEARCYDTMSPVNQARVEISCKDVGAPYNVGEIDWVKILRPTRLKIGHFGDVVEQIAAATEHVFKITRKSVRRQQGVALYRDVTVLARSAMSAAGPPTRPAADLPERRQNYRRQTTPTDDSVQNNTGPLGGPVIIMESVSDRNANDDVETRD